MNESHQEITRSVDAESSEHQFVRARVTGRVRANERSQQSMLAEALVAAANERRKLDKAS